MHESMRVCPAVRSRAIWRTTDCWRVDSISLLLPPLKGLIDSSSHFCVFCWSTQELHAPSSPPGQLPHGLPSEAWLRPGCGRKPVHFLQNKPRPPPKTRVPCLPSTFSVRFSPLFCTPTITQADSLVHHGRTGHCHAARRAEVCAEAVV